MSDVTERYSANAPHIREALDDAKAAVTRAKQAVSLQASSETAKKANPPSKTTPETSKRKRRVSEGGVKKIIAANKRWERVRAEAAKAQPARAKKTAPKRAAVKKAAVKAIPVKAATKSAPGRKAKKSALAPVQTVAKAAAQ
jgi:hypothetical protein